MEKGPFKVFRFDFRATSLFVAKASHHASDWASPPCPWAYFKHMQVSCAAHTPHVFPLYLNGIPHSMSYGQRATRSPPSPGASHSVVPNTGKQPLFSDPLRTPVPEPMEGLQDRQLQSSRPRSAQLTSPPRPLLERVEALRSPVGGGHSPVDDNGPESGELVEGMVRSATNFNASGLQGSLGGDRAKRVDTMESPRLPVHSSVAWSRRSQPTIDVVSVSASIS